jgi:hypothetical protein
MSTDDEIKKQYDLLYESISQKLQQQVESLGAIDTKSSILLAAIGVIFAGYLQLLTSSELGFTDLPVLVAVEILAFISSGFYVFRAFMLSKEETWRDDPRPSKLLEYFASHSDQGEYGLKDEVIKSMSESYELNDAKILDKYKHLHTARILLFIGIIVLVAHLFIILFSCW